MDDALVMSKGTANAFYDEAASWVERIDAQMAQTYRCTPGMEALVRTHFDTLSDQLDQARVAIVLGRNATEAGAEADISLDPYVAGFLTEAEDISLSLDVLLKS